MSDVATYTATTVSNFYFDAVKDTLYTDAAHSPARRAVQTVLHKVPRTRARTTLSLPLSDADLLCARP